MHAAIELEFISEPDGETDNWSSMQIVTAAHPMGQHLTATAYVALLPTIWSLLEEGREDIWSAVVEHCERAGTTSGVKKVAVEFVARLTLVSALPSPFGRDKCSMHCT